MNQESLISAAHEKAALPLATVRDNPDRTGCRSAPRIYCTPAETPPRGGARSTLGRDVDKLSTFVGRFERSEKPAGVRGLIRELDEVTKEEAAHQRRTQTLERMTPRPCRKAFP